VALHPRRATVPAGRTIPVSNVGGEFHTFSRTVEFGGGFVGEGSAGRSERLADARNLEYATALIKESSPSFTKLPG
jgi:hypothetical protein